MTIISFSGVWKYNLWYLLSVQSKWKILLILTLCQYKNILSPASTKNDISHIFMYDKCDILWGYDIIISLDWIWGLVKKCFPSIWKILKIHNIPTSFPIFIILYHLGKISLFIKWCYILVPNSSPYSPCFAQCNVCSFFYYNPSSLNRFWNNFWRIQSKCSAQNILN